MIRKVIDISVLLALECLHLDVCRASSSKYMMIVKHNVGAEQSSGDIIPQ